MIRIISRYWIFVPSLIILLGVIGLVGMYVVAYTRGEVVADATGRANLDFRVFYTDNEFFGGGEMPRDVSYLMSFTDYIEIDSGFSANFHSYVGIYYSYTAVERLVIRYMSTMDGNVNPMIYQTSREISSENGHEHARRLRLAGGTYTIDPRGHIDRYLDFLSAHMQQMEAVSIAAQGLRGFSAELFVNFIYTVYVPELNFRRTLEHGYRFSLSTEVFSLVTTGTPSFNETINITAMSLPYELSFPVILILAGALVLGVFGFVRGIRRLGMDDNPYRQELKTILKKYATEIIISEKMMNLIPYTLMPVKEFDELLKLAVNLNEQIMCFHDDKSAFFSIIIKNHAYVYEIIFSPDTEESLEYEVLSDFPEDAFELREIISR